MNLNSVNLDCSGSVYKYLPMKKIIYVIFMGISLGMNAQNLIISDDSTYSGISSNAVMEIHSSNGNKGIFIPRITTAQRTAIPTTYLDEGLVVYDVTTHSFWVWSDGQWKELGDKQTLSYDPNTGELSILNGNSITIPDNDNQQIYISNDTLYLTNGGSVDLSPYLDNTDNQQLTISGHTISLTNGGSVTVPDNDNQTLDLSGDSLFISNGNSVDLSVINTDAQTLTLIGDTLSISGGNSVDLSQFMDNTDDQNIQGCSVSGNNLIIGIENGNSQTVDLSHFMDNTDNQQLSISGHTISLVNGGSVTVPDTDKQTLSFNSSTYELSISNGNTVDLSSLAGSTDAWSLNGNSITTGQFLGTTNNMPLDIYTNDTLHLRITQKGQIEVLNTANSIFIGDSAGLSDDGAGDNIAVGYNALRNNHSGSGDYSGIFNIAVGTEALFSNYGGSDLFCGSYNIAIGPHALYSNHGGSGSWSGSYNVAIGASALYKNYGDGYGSGRQNVAIGMFAMYNNTTGAYNNAVGFQALHNNTIGYYNVACGYNAMDDNTTGDYNTAVGYIALTDNLTGNNNTALGAYAYPNDDNYSNFTIVGYNSRATASNQVRIGNSDVTSIGGYANWTNVSDKRFKRDIKENVPGLDFIMKLRPVTYHLDMDAIAKFLHTPDSVRLFDAEKTKGQMVWTGFIAQEVEKAAEEVGYDFSGVDKPKNDNDYYGLRYAEFVVPLVKAVQEQQKEIEELKEKNEILENENAEMKKMIEDFDERLKKLESK